MYLGFNQIFPDGEFGEIDDGVCLQFLHDMVFMGFYGLGAYEQTIGYFLFALSLSQVLKNLLFAMT